MRVRTIVLSVAFVVVQWGPGQVSAAEQPVFASFRDTALQWNPCAGGTITGCQVAVIRGVMESGPAEVFVRFAPGTSVPRIRHSMAERGLVLEGTLIGADGPIASGTYWYMPAGTIHGGVRCGDSGPCVVYEAYDGPFDVSVVP